MSQDDRSDPLPAKVSTETGAVHPQESEDASGAPRRTLPGQEAPVARPPPLAQPREEEPGKEREGDEGGPTAGPQFH